MAKELLNPWMLAALAAMAIPLIIEWLFRRRRQRIAFPAMRYLMNPKKRRRVQLQDLILLLIRTVVPGVLVFALARPLLRPEAGKGPEQTARHIVIVLDGTYSMGQSIGQTTAFEMAQTMAQDIVRGLPREADISLVYLGKRPVILKERTRDHDSVHDAITRAKVSDMAGRMADALEMADKLAAGADAEVYLVSDLQRSTWSVAADDPRDPQTLLARLGKRAFVLDTGGANVFNAYLTRFEPQDKVTAVGMENRYDVDIETRNMPTNGKLWLTLYADEDKAASPSDKKPGKLATRELTSADFRAGRATMTFAHAFVDPGEHLLRVELEGDGLATDNQRYYLANVPANVEVLIIDPRHDGTETATGGGALLRSAIAPRTPAGFDRLTPFAVTTRRPEEVLQLNLERFAVVALVNVGSPSDALVSRLEQYVSDGGSAIIFVGDVVAPYDYNTKLGRAGKGLLPCELEPAVGLSPADVVAKAKTPEKADGLLHGLSYTASEPHPAVANVRQMIRQPTPPSVSRWMPFKLHRKDGETANAVAHLSNKQPLVCERSFGQGKVMLVGTSADASWNYLVYTSEYLVLIQELMHWLIGEPDRGVNLQIGEAFQQPVLLSSQYLLLRRPDYNKVRLAPTAQGNLWRVAYDQTDRQGIYEVDTSAEVMPRRRFAVNLVASEGDLARVDLGSFQRDLDRSGTHYWGPDKAIRRAVESRHSITEYAWLFLWSVLALLAVETLLATRFGRRRI